MKKIARGKRKNQAHRPIGSLRMAWRNPTPLIPSLYQCDRRNLNAVRSSRHVSGTMTPVEKQLTLQARLARMNAAIHHVNGETTALT